MNLINQYLNIIADGESVSLTFLKKNHKAIKKEFGNPLFNECFLNFIMWYHPNNKKNLQRIQKTILSKKVHHKSDLAIIYNYNKYHNFELIFELIQISKSLNLEISNTKSNIYISHKVKDFFRKDKENK